MNGAIPAFFVAPTTIVKYELSNFQPETSKSMEGTKVQLNDDGRVTQIEYPSGATVRRHATYVLVRSNNSSYWFGDSHGRWYPID